MKRDENQKRNGVLWSRRKFLQASALGSVSLLLPWGIASRSTYAAGSPALTRFKDPLPVPAVMWAKPNGVYAVYMKQSSRRSTATSAR